MSGARLRAAGAAVAGALLLGACAKPPPPPQPPREWYVVMPKADGRVGRVVVIRDGKEVELEGDFASVRSGEAAPGRADPKEVQAAFAPALAATPARPVSFLLFFVEDRTDLVRESRGELDKVAREVQQRAAPEVTIIGHADTTGSHTYNDRLSARRAERIRDELVRLGVSAEVISIAARGKREPMVPTPDMKREPRNRRVAIEVR